MNPFWAALIGATVAPVAIKAGKLFPRMWNGDITLAEFVVAVTVIGLAAGAGAGLVLLGRWMLTFPIGEDRR